MNITGENCTYGALRLAGGSDKYEGRVEICINDAWGTVCDDFWGNVDAAIVCQQLGYDASGVWNVIKHKHIIYSPKLYFSLNTKIIKGAEAFRFSYFGAGTGPIFLDNVQCTGSEASLLECPSNPIGNENCNHNTDAGVRCPGHPF